MLNIFSVDVEDYFHPSEVVTYGNIKAWSTYPSRVHIGLNFLLETLAQHDVRATFFILGWVAEHHPALIRNIVDADHEIGCHSYEHQLVYDLTPRQFKEDTLRAVRVIEDACGATPRAYRAPSYSIVSKNLWALEVLVECGFTHDSSIYPVVHDRYGVPGFERHAHTIETPSGPITEVPAATALLGKQVIPVAGGAYLRLFPYRYTAAGIRRINSLELQPACMYVHPWEADPDQPKLNLTGFSRVRTYGGLKTVRSKITRLLSDFQFSTITAVHPMHALAPIAS
jgi:polysaccharide deacetylase family protein (PEP-CTERM system associated)